MPISSKTLFHFTNSVENLLGILSENFFPKFCLEDHCCLSKTKLGTISYIKLAIPMVCFCDIPLSSVSEHIGFYGNYGIGLTKEWGIKKGINPVVYVVKDTYLAECILRMLKWIGKHKEDLAYTDAIEFLAFIKAIEGETIQNGEYITKYFYDEREWRYVPNIVPTQKEPNGLDYRLTLEEFNDDIKRNLANTQLQTRAILEFEPKDIKYIIVARESEITDTINNIRRIKGKFKYSPQEIDLLASRVISSEQIKSDF